MVAVQDMANAHSRPLPLPSRPRSSAEVIVIGAGLSGLRAAHHVQSAGSSCLVLEATGCVGGRLARGCHRQGFNASRHVRVAELAHRLGLEVAPPRARQGENHVVQGLGACGADGIPEGLAADDRRALVRVRANVEALCQRVDVNRPAEQMPNYGTTTVRELVASQGGTAAVQRLANSWTLTLFGLDSHRVSALYFLVHCKCAGGLLRTLSDLAGDSQELRVSGGLSALCEELAARLQPGSVLLSQHVDSIDQTPGNKCLLTTRSGAIYQCAKVILAASASQCRTVDFVPDLSADKRWLRNPAAAGFSRSMTLAFDQPWWRERGFSGLAQALDGPVCMVHDGSSDDAGALSALTCLVAGESGRELWRASKDDRLQAVLRSLGAIFGDDVPAPVGVTELDWETHSSACLAVPAAHLHDLERDQWRPEGSIFFAGSAASFVARGHAEGALAAGSRAAEEVMCALQPRLDADPVPRL